MLAPHIRRQLRQTLCFFLVLFLPCALADAGDDRPLDPSTARQWGAETLATIQKEFYLRDRSLYSEEINTGKPPRPSWIWDAGIQLGALCSAARQEPVKYLPQLKSYAAALRTYRTTYHDRPGLDVNPPPKNPDRYYDDNAWIAISLLEAYALTHDRNDLSLATDAYNFALSGEDQSIGGGIYWHEDRPRSKNACSSGPAMIAALGFYDLTKDAKYLETAKRLHDWTCAHLQDQDGLIYDSISVPAGNINHAKLTYNSGTLIRADCLLFRVTGEQRYLEEAQRVAHAAEKRFVRADDGIITGAGKLAVKLVEAFLELSQTDHDEHWRQVVGRCLSTLHQHRNALGYYPQDWQSPPLPADHSARLIDQAAPARAYWLAAEQGAPAK